MEGLLQIVMAKCRGIKEGKYFHEKIMWNDYLGNSGGKDFPVQEVKCLFCVYWKEANWIDGAFLWDQWKSVF